MGWRPEAVGWVRAGCTNSYWFPPLFGGFPRKGWGSVLYKTQYWVLPPGTARLSNVKELMHLMSKLVSRLTLFLEWYHSTVLDQSINMLAWNWIRSCSTESADPTGTRGAPPSRSSSSPSSPSCSRRGPPVQKLSSRLAESFFRSAPSSVESQNHWYWFWFSTQFPLSHKTHWNSSGNMKLILVVYIVNIDQNSALLKPLTQKPKSWAGFSFSFAVIDTLPFAFQSFWQSVLNRIWLIYTLCAFQISSHRGVWRPHPPKKCNRAGYTQNIRKNAKKITKAKIQLSQFSHSSRMQKQQPSKKSPL